MNCLVLKTTTALVSTFRSWVDTVISQEGEDFSIFALTKMPFSQREISRDNDMNQPACTDSHEQEREGIGYNSIFSPLTDLLAASKEKGLVFTYLIICLSKTKEQARNWPSELGTFGRRLEADENDYTAASVIPQGRQPGCQSKVATAEGRETPGIIFLRPHRLPPEFCISNILLFGTTNKGLL